jgi:hypothetical protein
MGQIGHGFGQGALSGATVPNNHCFVRSEVQAFKPSIVSRLQRQQVTEVLAPKMQRRDVRNGSFASLLTYRQHVRSRSSRTCKSRCEQRDRRDSSSRTGAQIMRYDSRTLSGVLPPAKARAISSSNARGRKLPVSGADYCLGRRVIRVNSGGRPSRSANPGQSPVPLFT